MKARPIYVRVSTVPSTLNVLLENQLRYLNQFYEVHALSSPGAHLDELAVREGVKIKGIVIQREISFWQDLKSFLLIFLYLFQLKPYVIQSNTPKASLLTMIAGYLVGVKNRVYVVTGLRYESEFGFKRRLLINFEKLTCYFATHIIAESKGVKDLLLEDKIANGEIYLIGNGNINGIDLSYWNPDLFFEKQLYQLKKELNITNSIVFLFVGRLVGDKGVNELVDVFNLLSKESKTNVKLLLIGDYEHALDSLMPQTKCLISENVDIIKLPFQKDIRKYFLISDCLVLPSYREGFSNVSLQAGAMGVPIIITDVNGAQDLVRPGVNGLIIRKYDKTELYNSMRLFTEGKIKFDPCKLREIITEKFSQDFFYTKLMEFYFNYL